jgi:hypothetical protein
MHTAAVHILEPGTYTPEGGGAVVLSRQALESIASTTNRKIEVGVSVPIYERFADVADQSADTRHAATAKGALGWINRLEATAGGLLAHVSVASADVKGALVRETVRLALELENDFRDGTGQVWQGLSIIAASLGLGRPTAAIGLSLNPNRARVVRLSLKDKTEMAVDQQELKARLVRALERCDIKLPLDSIDPFGDPEGFVALLCVACENAAEPSPSDQLADATPEERVVGLSLGTGGNGPSRKSWLNRAAEAYPEIVLAEIDKMRDRTTLDEIDKMMGRGKQ